MSRGSCPGRPRPHAAELDLLVASQEAPRLPGPCVFDHVAGAPFREDDRALNRILGAS